MNKSVLKGQCHCSEILISASRIFDNVSGLELMSRNLLSHGETFLVVSSVCELQQQNDGSNRPWCQR